MKTLHFFLFLATVPVLISLGHDFYLYYLAQDQVLNLNLLTKIYTEDRPGKSFDFAAIGLIWLKYSPDTYQALAESYTPEEWAGVQEFLKMKATLVLAALAILMYVLALLVHIIKISTASTAPKRR